ncbi:MAG: UvrD-helicase domain-containing protein [Bacillota bacterium]
MGKLPTWSDGLDASQRRVAGDLGQSLAVTAGAGSGKTKTLIARYLALIEEQGLTVPEIVAITFTVKAAQELRGRVRAAAAARLDERGPWPQVLADLVEAPIGTIHAFCAELLRSFPAEAGVDPKFAIARESATRRWSREAARQAVREALRHGPEAALVTSLVEQWGYGRTITLVSGLTERLRSCGDDQAQWDWGLAAGTGGVGPEALGQQLSAALRSLQAEHARLYAAARDAAHALDFNDLEDKAELLLADPAVRAECRRRWRAVLVDEYQDVNARQDRIIRRLCGEAGIEPGRLFAVGDAKQSIYRFRGADVSCFRALASELGAGGSASLQFNYRSLPQLLDGWNGLFAADDGLALGVDYAPLTAVRPPADPEAVSLELVLGADRPGAAGLLAGRLQELLDAGANVWDEGARAWRLARPGDIAILFPARTHLRVYTAALTAAGVPYHVVDAAGLLDLAEAADLAAVLRAVADPADDVALAAYLRGPLARLDDPRLLALSRDGLCAPSGPLGEGAEPALLRLARWRELARSAPVTELLDAILRDTGYRPWLAAAGGEQAVANLERFMGLARREGVGDVHAFLEFLDDCRAAQEDAPAVLEGEGAQAVHLLTVHKAKGLEWPIVVIAEAGRRRYTDALPYVYSPGKGVAVKPLGAEDKPVETAAVQELRAVEDLRDGEEFYRLLYVAMTRARDRLLISGHRGRNYTGSWLARLEGWLGLDGTPAANIVCSHPHPFAVTVSVATPQGEPPWSLAGRPDRIRPVADGFPLIAPVPGGVPGWRRYSPTQLLLYAECPKRHGFAHLDQLRPASSRPQVGLGGPDPGTLLGIVVHRACQLAASGLEPITAVKAAVAEQGAGTGLDIAGRALPMVKAAVAGPLAAEGRAEVPFLWVAEAGLAFDGIIDWLALDGDPAVIWDFKSNRLEGGTAPLVEHYRPQLQLYALAVRELAGKERVAARIFFLRNGETAAVPTGEADLSAARDELLALAAGIEAGRRTASPGSHCSHCPYTGLCEEAAHAS